MGVYSYIFFVSFYNYRSELILWCDCKYEYINIKEISVCLTTASYSQEKSYICVFDTIVTFEWAHPSKWNKLTILFEPCNFVLSAHLAFVSCIHNMCIIFNTYGLKMPSSSHTLYCSMSMLFCCCYCCIISEVFAEDNEINSEHSFTRLRCFKRG